MLSLLPLLLLLPSLLVVVVDFVFNVFDVKAEEEEEEEKLRRSRRPRPVVVVQGARPVHKATIVPRGHALGMVMQLPDKDELNLTRKQLLAMLDVTMGGRVAEELIFGKDEITTGASSDLQQATRLAREMITKYGFSQTIGLASQEYNQGGLSSETRQKI